LSQIVERLDALGRELKDLADSIRILARHWRQDPERLAAVDERLLLLRRLETKYGRSVDDLVVYRAELDERERELETEQRDCVATSDKLLGAFAACRDAGRRLGQLRRQAAKKLIRAARRHLTELGMPDAALGVSLTPIDVSGDPMTADLPGLGFERLELLLAANPGEPALPLRRVASGGELSRAMLALKSALAGHDRVGTMIFDEIDANVGGRLGHVLGRKLAALSKNRQVICVTHLPQVAACAPRQWSIRKQRSGQRTVATIQPLDERQRLDELAVMLRGDAHSETTRREAAAMLKAGKAWW
jgi:DNA repair protein RecN (Recombination protein N)